MGNQRQGDWSNFTFFTPFNQQEHYHSFCEIKDFSNQNEVCVVSVSIVGTAKHADMMLTALDSVCQAQHST